MRRIITIVVALLASTSLALAITIHVPSQYPTIQAGISAAVDGDTVLVAAGTYLETIDYLGKEIVVRSASGPEVTAIEWDQPNERVVTFNSGEGRGAVLEGFTVRHTYPGEFVGSGVYCGQGTAAVVRNNIITSNGNFMSYWEGGIYASGASPLIEGNQIVENESCYFGGGIYLNNCSDFIITGNTIASNYCWSGYGFALGGGIYATHSSGMIDHNLIHLNVNDFLFGGGGGGIALEEPGNYQIYNNTLSNNESTMPGQGTGGGIYIAGVYEPAPNVDMQSNIIVSCFGGGIYYVVTGGPGQSTIDFNDVWNNPYFNYSGCTPGLFDICEDPRFVGGIPYSYELMETSPCINAGAFTAQPDLDGTRADMGAFYFDQEGMNIAIVPDEWPIIIPAAGGSFSYTIHLTNHTSGSVEFDVWVDVQLPDGTVFGPIILREGVTFNPNQHLERQLTQTVPGGAPIGSYLYMAHTGDYSTGQIYHETLMPFTKEGTGGSSGDWQISSTLDDLEGESGIGPVAHRKLDLKAAPNPFNPEITLSFSLPGAGRASLKIYDVTGRMVATLLDRELQAGFHTVQFNGNHLASGIYLAVLKSGNVRTVERLLLVK